MNIVLFDELKVWQDLLPLTYTRPTAAIRIGILSVFEKWERSMPEAKVSFKTQEHLEQIYSYQECPISYFINGSVLPNAELCDQIKGLKVNESIVKGKKLVAFHGSLADFNELSVTKNATESCDIVSIDQVYDLFQKNGIAIKLDFELLTRGRKSQSLSESVTVIGDKSLVFLEEGAVAEACILNTKSGPIYLAKDSEIMEGSVVRGPFSLGEQSALKLSTKIYGPTTVGPHSKVGGEVNNSVIFGYSNKAHDGFLGNSVLGEWCNLGADTNNSNLKNNYSHVKLFNYREYRSVDTGLQFCGLIMGDYSKSGINTMFNTGTVVGVAGNIFGGGFPPTHIPSFSWGGAEGFEVYQIEKLFETSERVFERRGLSFGDKDKAMLKAVFQLTVDHRNE
jgi:UDP-N-acetylglucosamine diphosphorylase/glucosamine-1-phosphate N-acetyltransferase